jgi:signal transduction histidine kinase/DNA-binding response OmpR family regulator
MTPFRDLSVQRKLMAIIMATTVLALLLASAAFFAYDAVTFRDKMVRDLGTLARTLEANTVQALVYNDRAQASQILAGLEVQPNIKSAAIYDGDGELFASYSRSGGVQPLAADAAVEGHEFRDGHLFLHRPMVYREQVMGTFQIQSDLGQLAARRTDYLKILIVVILGVSLLALAFSSGLQRLVSRPILELSRIAREVSEKKDFSVRARAAGRDEVGRLIDGFNDMLAQIQARDRELIVARDKAEEANRSKSLFLANMSHELRTPLTAIIGYSEILEDDAGEMGLEDFLPDLQKIKAAGKHLLGLINSILDLSKVEAGKMELYVESFEIPTLVSEVASTVMPLIEKNGNTLDVVLREDVGSTRGDLTKTRQILFNLLSNASKFTEGGRVTLEVARRGQGGIEGFEYRIGDTGIGMTGEQLSRLFKPFTQADATTARKYGGTGLGLVLCKRFCQVMGGRIDVDSKPGEGTVFTVWLPAEMDADKAPVSLQEMIESGTWKLGDAVAKATSKAGPLVLVIDDDPAVHELLQDLLAREGFRVATAASGEEGLQLARQLQPAIITLDVYLPGMDGWEVLNRLKSDAELASIPVIMISISDQAQHGYALGAEYLSKPIDRKRLAALLHRYRGNDGGAPVGLVIDDDPQLRALVRHLLEEQGWQVTEAENGIAGLRRLAERPPNLILLDLMMPQLDGFGFMTQLRKNSAWRGVPVVVLTAMDLGPEERRRLNGGVERILEKGAYSLDELKAEIRSLARERLNA